MHMSENENNDVSINHPKGDTKTSFRYDKHLRPFYMRVPAPLSQAIRHRCVEYVLREARLRNYYFGKYC